MNILIAYFSYTGHTKGIARQIQALTGGDLFEIRPAAPYSQDYDTAERRGRRETRDGVRPPLAGAALDLSGYDAVLLGTPTGSTPWRLRWPPSWLKTTSEAGPSPCSAPTGAAVWGTSQPTSRRCAGTSSSWTA